MFEVMQHYIDPAGGLHALSLEQIEMGFEARLPEGCTKISDDEAEQVRAAQRALIDPQIDINATARAYLASTDWYVIRKQETDEPIPADVLQKRQQARASIK